MGVRSVESGNMSCHVLLCPLAWAVTQNALIASFVQRVVLS